jgi:type I restriction enzyme M protein
MDASQIGKRAWSYAGVLQDARLSCFEYVEQLTLLLFLRMADQLTEEPYNRPPIVPPDLGWKALLTPDGVDLEAQYRASLEKLGVKPGMLGVIFKGARCELHNPALGAGVLARSGPVLHAATGHPDDVRRDATDSPRHRRRPG